MHFVSSTLHFRSCRVEQAKRFHQVPPSTFKYYQVPSSTALFHIHLPYVLRLACAPIGVIQIVLHRLQKRRMRPIGRPRGISVFNRIVMNVIHVVAPILFITNQMFPETFLPDKLFLPLIERRVNTANTGRYVMFYLSPAR